MQEKRQLGMKFAYSKHGAAFVVYLTILVLGLVAISAAVRPGNYEIYDMQAVKMESHYIANEPPESLDVLFIGNSIAYSAFSPLHFWKESGFTSYVLATPGQRLCDTYAILYNALHKQSPKVVVLETNSFYKDIGTDQNQKDVIFNLYAKIFPILKYHSFYKSNSDNAIYDKFSLYKGFRPYEAAHGLQKPFADYIDHDMKAVDIPKGNLKYLNELYDLCRQDNTNLVLISAPTTNSWNYGRHLGIANWAKMHRIKYTDMNLLPDQVGINWKEDTRDGGDHMNIYGARVVDKFVANYLKKNFVLPDRRNDVKYASWNSDCKRAKIY